MIRQCAPTAQFRGDVGQRHTRAHRRFGLAHSKRPLNHRTHNKEHIDVSARHAIWSRNASRGELRCASSQLVKRLSIHANRLKSCQTVQFYEPERVGLSPACSNSNLLFLESMRPSS